MDEVEVDVQLFIKCRMCLDQQGVYQIAPNMINNIKFCFDIDIEPFDGLPQLICKGCKSKLTEYYQIKKTFQEKQMILKEKLFNKKEIPAPSPAVSSGGAGNEKEELPVVTPAITPVDTPAITPVDTAARVVNKHSWKNDYQEHFVCIICNKTYLSRSSVQRHVKHHRAIVNRHKKVFKQYCTVQLNKIDENLNMAGCLNVVVYNHEKLIANRRNSRFGSIFMKKIPIDAQSSKENIENSSSFAASKRPASASSNEEIGKGKKKRISHFSSSSTQTAILEDRAECDTSNNLVEPNDGPPPVAGTRDTHDDTPSDRPPTNNLGSDMKLRQRKPTKPSIANYKAIQSIVAMCNKKHMKKVQSDYELMNKKPKICESSLKRKILSLGRKVINNKGFGCTGLLRYMEHKDLEITWQPVTLAYQNKASNFVRIMPKMKSRENLDNDNAGWKDLEVISLFNKEVVSGSENEDSGFIVPVEPEPAKTDNEENVPSSSNITKEDLSDRVLNVTTASDLYYKNKLLNKTPVANPKQLPSKKNVSETKPLTIVPNEPTDLQPLDVNSELENEELPNGNFCMPIITSTQSLFTNVEEDEVTKAEPIIDKPKPRIKVKPVSELMPERPSINQNSDNIWAVNNRLHVGLACNLTDTMVYVAAPISQSQGDGLNDQSVSEFSNPENNNSPIDKTNGNEAKDLEFVTLDTLELPNTKTRTPFQYFKMVLLYHGLYLLELNEELPDNFKCLVKFKLVLRQDTKQPLGVILSLFCSDNRFCFHFKDSKLRKFDPSQLPAFWQWELLKIYKGDVVKKILHNTAKIGKEIHENTENFLCLLKSINLNT